VLGIDDQTNPDMMTMMGKLKHLDLIKNYQRVPDIQMPEDDAEYDPSSQVLRLGRGLKGTHPEA